MSELSDDDREVYAGWQVDAFTSTVRSILPEGWSIHDENMAPDFLLECPHGATIEQDGRCPEGCVSPMIEAGLV
jgi:hypothetical protein